MPVSQEDFLFGHNILTNKLPKGGNLSVFNKIAPRLGEGQFGLFDSSANNYNTFYPDLSPEDLQPKDEDFVYPVYRALSQTVLSKFGPVDFTREGVLKSSFKKLVGQSVFANHDRLVGNELGVVVDAEWQEAYEANGFKVPAGINVKLKVDSKKSPGIVRGIMMDPPSVHSTSVTINFGWEKSHPEMSDDEFYEKMGTYDNKGNLVSRVVTRIFKYDEISLVSHGADPYAQKVGPDGRIVNPEYANTAQKMITGFSMDYKDLFQHVRTDPHTVPIPDYTDPKIWEFISGGTSPYIPTIPPAIKSNQNSNQTSRNMNKEMLAFLVAFFALPEDSSEEVVSAKLQAELPLMKGQITSLQGELQVEKDARATAEAVAPPTGALVLTTEEDKKKFTEFDAVKGIADKAINSTRDEVLKLYGLSVEKKENEDPNIITMIQGASFDALCSLAKQYKNIVESKFVAVCHECGSHNVSRASTADPETGIVSPGTGGSTSQTKSFNDTVQEIAKDTRPIAGILFKE